ncbi:MAG: hypothetical protein LIO87_10110 [Eubacterium sp.]|nr:hypothetical protein [Eubacterium sp.]
MIFIDIISFVLKLIPLILILAAAYFIIADDERNIFAMIKRNQPVLKRRVIPLALAAVLFFGVSFFTSSAEEALYCKVTVGLNYLESSSGLNPNKTKFTASELTDDAVMEKIIAQGGYDVDAETLKSGFTVRPVRINDSVSLDKPYVATEYSVMFSAKTAWAVSGLPRLWIIIKQPFRNTLPKHIQEKQMFWIWIFPKSKQRIIWI